MQALQQGGKLHAELLYGAYSWLLLSGLLQFGIDVVSQVLRGKRVPGPDTTLYYGLNTAYALSQVLFAVLAVFAIKQGLTSLGSWPGVSLGLIAAAAWLALCFRFLEYPQPRATLLVFVALLLGAAFTF